MWSNKWQCSPRNAAVPLTFFFTESGESPPGFNLRMETQSIPLAIMI
jgi:hypothetical protein